MTFWKNILLFAQELVSGDAVLVEKVVEKFVKKSSSDCQNVRGKNDLDSAKTCSTPTCKDDQKSDNDVKQELKG